MLKVKVNPTGEIVNDHEIIGKISGFFSTDFVKDPHLLRTLNVKLYDGKTITLSYGGIKNSEFAETCHLSCKWGNQCISYKRGNCIHNPEYNNLGFYIN